jgi:3-oxoacyl-[acyl-carrier-protein] synthase II
VNVSSTKSATGHMLGAAGAVESIFTTLAIHHGIIPPTINLQSPDPECDLDCTANVPVKRTVNAALNNSSGFGGHNTSIAIIRHRD